MDLIISDEVESNGVDTIHSKIDALFCPSRCAPSVEANLVSLDFAYDGAPSVTDWIEPTHHYFRDSSECILMSSIDIFAIAAAPGDEQVTEGEKPDYPFSSDEQTEDLEENNISRSTLSSSAESDSISYDATDTDNSSTPSLAEPSSPRRSERDGKRKRTSRSAMAGAELARDDRRPKKIRKTSQDLAPATPRRGTDNADQSNPNAHLFVWEDSCRQRGFAVPEANSQVMYHTFVYEFGEKTATQIHH